MNDLHKLQVLRLQSLQFVQKMCELYNNSNFSLTMKTMWFGKFFIIGKAYIKLRIVSGSH